MSNKSKKIRWNKWHRVIHYWGAIACALPVLVVIVSGVFLLLKKESAWIQPPSQRGSSKVPSVHFEQVMAALKTVPEAEIESWGDVDLLDVRPSKGIIKARSKNRWEIELDAATCEVLQVAYRRSDLIEELHDGSFFHDKAKLGLFLPSAIILLVLWVTGLYLFAHKLLIQRRNQHRNKVNKQIIIK